MTRSLKVKLLRPPSTTSFPSFPRLPYGMGVMTETLRKNGYEVSQDDLFAQISELNKGQDLFSKKTLNPNLNLFSHKRINRYLKDENPGADRSLNLFLKRILSLTSYKNFDIMGFSLHSASEFLYALLLARTIKEEIQTPIIFGGPFITLHAGLYFSKFKQVDYMMVGDGRIPFLKFLAFLEGEERLENVSNLYYRRKEEVQINPREYFPIEDIPLPDYDGLPWNSYKQGVEKMGMIFLPYQISRGCTAGCSFCTFRNVDESPGIKSADKVIRELEEYTRRYRSKYLTMCDTTFNVFPEETEIICDRIAQRQMDIKWEAFIKVVGTSENMLVKMKKAGCRLAKLGIESGSERMLKLMRKGFTIDQVSRALRMTQGVGINNRIYIIVGYPHETQEDVKKTIRFIKENKDYIQSFSIYRFHLDYGSPMYNRPEEFGLENIKDETLFYFSYDEIGGRKFRRLRKAQTKTMLKILKQTYEDLLKEKYCIERLPFLFYLLCEKIGGSFLWPFIRLLPRRFSDVVFRLDTRYLNNLGGRYGIYITKYLFPFQKMKRYLFSNRAMILDENF